MYVAPPARVHTTVGATADSRKRLGRGCHLGGWRAAHGTRPLLRWSRVDALSNFDPRHEADGAYPRPPCARPARLPPLPPRRAISVRNASAMSVASDTENRSRICTCVRLAAMYSKTEQEPRAPIASPSVSWQRCRKWQPWCPRRLWWRQQWVRCGRKCAGGFAAHGVANGAAVGDSCHDSDDDGEKQIKARLPEPGHVHTAARSGSGVAWV